MLKVIFVILSVGNTVSTDTIEFNRMTTCRQVLSSTFGTMLVAGWERVDGTAIALTKDGETVSLACIKEKVRSRAPWDQTNPGLES